MSDITNETLLGNLRQINGQAVFSTDEISRLQQRKITQVGQFVEQTFPLESRARISRDTGISEPQLSCLLYELQDLAPECVDHPIPARTDRGRTTTNRSSVSTSKY